MMSLIIILLLLYGRLSLCSEGDWSPVYRSCLKHCIVENCSEGEVSFVSHARIQQDFWSWLLQWSCKDECRYECMWGTVDHYEPAGYVPKFHGKWPFIRVLGIQEPASTFSSLLNLAAHAFMYTKLRKEFPFKRAPLLVRCTHLFAFVCMHAWLWSTIFHTRDKDFTEFMDYACALSMVMAFSLLAVVRMFQDRKKLILPLVAFPVFYFGIHVQYLYRGKIDYGFNMAVNIAFGVCGFLLWTAWSCQQWSRGRRHAWRMLAFTALSGASMALELRDFAPLARAWDAHALWHLSTAPLPLLFYRCIIDDLRYLRSGTYEKFGLKST